MKLWERYHTPTTVDEAVALLQQYAGTARIIAGGTDLLVEMREGHHDPFPALIDITSIPSLRTIQIEKDTVYIGAGVAHTPIVKNPVLVERATCLVESCGVIGGPQVRNVGTLGGNVAHALPAGDGTTSLVALDAEVEIFKNGKRRWVNILEMFTGPGQSLLDSTRDVLLQFRFRLSGKNEATAFKRIMRPQGVALPILGCAFWVRLDESREYFDMVRVCIAPIAPTPTRISEIEEVLKGQPANEVSIQKAVDTGLKVVHPRTSKYRATAEYRQEMMELLLRRTLPLAIERARTGKAIPEGVGLK